MKENDVPATSEVKVSELDERLALIKKTEETLKEELHKENLGTTNKKSVNLCLAVAIISSIVLICVLLVILQTSDYMKLTFDTIIFLAILGLTAMSLKELVEIYSENHKYQEQRSSTIHKCWDKLQELKVRMLEKELNK